MKNSAAKKYHRKRRSYKKKKHASKKLVKLVKSIVHKDAESKYGVLSVSSYPIAYDIPITWNLAAQLSRGTGEHQFIGEQINVGGIRIDYKMDNYCQNTVGGGFYNGPTWCNIAIIATKKYVNATSLLISDVVDSSYGNYTAEVHKWDPEKVKVLAINKFQLNNFALASTSGNELNGQLRERVSKIWLPFRGGKKWKFKDLSVDFDMAVYNYYIFVWNKAASNFSGNINVSGRLTMNATIYFKDC
jgi:hypothetical protein